MNLSDLRKKADKFIAEYEHAKRTVKEEKIRLKEAKETLKDTLEAQTFLQNVAQQVQESAHGKISEVVTKCLRGVFGKDSYEFRIIFERKRGKTEARIAFYRDGLLLEDPSDESGGGVIDVAAFALRLACLVLSKPPRRRFLALDEPFRFVDREYRPRVRAMLETLSEEMDVQIILVTHDPEFEIGKVVEIR
jgi:DNA repair exonuclease SbcCD ATPase subunit